MKGFRFEDFVHKKTLIKGEVGSGKTALTRSLIEGATSTFGARRAEITVIDMAPGKTMSGCKAVGGSLELEGEKAIPGITYMWAVLIPPRLRGQSREEVLRLAAENAGKIDIMLKRYLIQPTEVLFMNDLTMYLHAGKFEKLSKAVNSADTFVGNAYEGSYINDDFGSGITERETELLHEIEKITDRIITL